MHPFSPCMRNGSCLKGFPEQLRSRTSLDVDGYPRYRRRNLSPTEINGIPYTDEWVVATNPYLLLKYDCRLNLEICGIMSAVKYLNKYIYKGPDRARVNIENEPHVENQNIDEIKQHLNTRYVCAPQRMHRIFGYTMQDKSHTLYRLAVHLPELQTVHFVQGREQQEQAQRRFTTLTAFLELNRRCAQIFENGLPSDFTVDVRNIYYFECRSFLHLIPATDGP
ncbi:hypothetical protein GCK32_018692 [Trichostrongylus colubriformis]|uniref:Helitron helicase-like domain-containing protein n=1 Tax=Trichostrongylus colubriformis TaxID=6319 RepID=A0AAN8IC27_TRICO